MSLTLTLTLMTIAMTLTMANLTLTLMGLFTPILDLVARTTCPCRALWIPGDQPPSPKQPHESALHSPICGCACNWSAVVVL